MQYDFSPVQNGESKDRQLHGQRPLTVLLKTLLILMVAFCLNVGTLYSSEVPNSLTASMLYEQGLRFERQGLKLLAVECFDLARKKEPNTYRYHRVYMRAVHQIGANHLMRKEYRIRTCRAHGRVREVDDIVSAPRVPTFHRA